MSNVIFDLPMLESQFAVVQPEVRKVIEDLGDFSVAEKLPKPIVTHVHRRKIGQRLIYLPYAHALLNRGHQGGPLTPGEETLFKELEPKSEEELEHWAEHKPSWHLWDCAVDLRNRHYKSWERQQAFEFLKGRCEAPLWELLAHDVGRGDHIHVARRDFGWRKEKEAALG